VAGFQAGKLYSPFWSVTTVVVMVEPSFLALTSTPSIGPSSAELTCPESVAAACASALVGNPADARMPNRLALARSERCFNRIVCLPIYGSFPLPSPACVGG